MRGRGRDSSHIVFRRRITGIAVVVMLAVAVRYTRTTALAQTTAGGSGRSETTLEWVEENGKFYWYENGVKQGTQGRGKEIFDPASGYWYWLDAVQGGARTCSKDVYLESYAGVYADKADRTGKWVRYDENGHMVKGWDANEKGIYYFDEYTGAMAKGMVVLDRMLYSFDLRTGVMIESFGVGDDFKQDGWNTIDGNRYWFEGGVKQGIFGRGKEVYDPESEAWYWLDAVDGGKMAVSKDVYQESAAGDWGDIRDRKKGIWIGKWVRYDENGHMVKGWTPERDYYFDPVYGTMAKGVVTIDGEDYLFDRISGICRGEYTGGVHYVERNKGKQDYLISSSPISSYLVPQRDGDLMRVQAAGTLDGVLIEYYNRAYRLQHQRIIPQELPIFGGFCQTDDAYYLITGQLNPEESDDTEVMRITKYDRDWHRIAATGIFGANTVEPFRAGSLRAVQCGKYLIVRTCHQMYVAEDGKNHQASATFELDTETMEITDSHMEVKAGGAYISHSFNQFICLEGKDIVTLDHGDAYPRSAVLYKFNADVSDGTFLDHTASRAKRVDIMKFAGKAGNNDTGASLGGFEISATDYLAVGSSIVQDGDDQRRRTRNIFVAAVDRTTLEPEIRWVTEYQEGDRSASTPHFIRIAENEYLLLWTQEYDSRVYYTKVDGHGGCGEIYAMSGSLSDCVPAVVDDSAVWYVCESGNLNFYAVDLLTMEGGIERSIRLGK